LGLVIVDYLQLMTSPRRSENRQQEVSEISRNLKILAKELEVPVLCASQLNRAVEARADKRPLLGDLRESGCLTGDTRVALADGRDVPIASLEGKTPEVVTLAGWHLQTQRASKVWKTGHRPVYELTLATGRKIRATDNHPFLIFEGWKPLGDLKVGDRVGVARRLNDPPLAKPWEESRVILLAHLIGDGCYASRQPLHYTSCSEANLRAVTDAAQEAFGITAKRVQQENWWHLYLSAGANKWHPNPLKTWLQELGIDGQRSKEKVVPDEVFSLPNSQVALFLRHLWATDGCVWLKPEGARGPIGRIYYASSSPTLAFQVQALLRRLDITSRIRAAQKEGYSPSFHVSISS
ncbi:MAG: DnaB-like helicase C-terminal domain-containing protein, partial [Acidimicrobiia bacterium]